MSRILDTSIAVSLLGHFHQWYERLEQRVNYIYQDSQTYKLTEEFWKKIKNCFRYSFLGKITETKQKSFAFLDDSRTVQYLISFCKRCTDKLIRFARTSLMVSLTKDIKEQINFFPARMASAVVFTAIVVNVFLSLVFQRQISLWGWLMRGILLFSLATAIFCKSNWINIKESSLFLRKIQKD